MYCDTDSVIFIRKGNDPPKAKTEDYMSDVTDELDEYGSRCFVEEFVSGGPKSIRFRYFASRLENVKQSVK